MNFRTFSGGLSDRSSSAAANKDQNRALKSLMFPYTDHGAKHLGAQWEKNRTHKLIKIHFSTNGCRLSLILYFQNIHSKLYQIAHAFHDACDIFCISALCDDIDSPTKILFIKWNVSFQSCNVLPNSEDTIFVKMKPIEKKQEPILYLAEPRKCSPLSSRSMNFLWDQLLPVSNMLIFKIGLLSFC